PTHRASRVDPSGVQTPPQHPAAAPPATASRHLSRHVLRLPGLRDASAPESPLSPLVSHLVWHVYVLQSKAGALRLHTAQDLILSPPVGSADRVGGPGTPVYGSQVVLPGVLRHEPGCPQRLSPSSWHVGRQNGSL